MKEAKANNDHSSVTINVAEALAAVPESAPVRFTKLFERGALTVEIYAPRGTDPQTPHSRDEIYVVISGTGEFVSEGKRRRIAPHDFIFVAAGVEHRFENFSGDFATWVFFYGAEGGELPG